MPSFDPPDPTLGAVRYRVRHANLYRYGREIMLAHHQLHLAPRLVPRQHVLAHGLAIDPGAAVIGEHADLFGNPTTYLEMHEPHLTLSIESSFDVDVAAVNPEPGRFDTPWEWLRDRLAEPAGPAERSAAPFAFDSPMIVGDSELAAFAQTSFTPGRGIGDAAMDLTKRIFEEFRFDATATTIATPIADVLANRRGVCQDFAHLAIGCLRSLGLAARYVSGYLRTIPPPGRPRSIGSDVSHAWLSVWCGGEDWLDFDPTNGRSQSSDLITLAWGRDYGDVSPTRGVILGSSIQYLSVSVDVETLSEFEPPPGDIPAATG